MHSWCGSVAESSLSEGGGAPASPSLISTSIISYTHQLPASPFHAAASPLKPSMSSSLGQSTRKHPFLVGKLARFVRLGALLEWLEKAFLVYSRWWCTRKTCRKERGTVQEFRIRISQKRMRPVPAPPCQFPLMWGNPAPGGRFRSFQDPST